MAITLDDYADRYGEVLPRDELMTRAWELAEHMALEGPCISDPSSPFGQ